MSDRLAGIKAWRNRYVIHPKDKWQECWQNVDWLIAEVERLRHELSDTHYKWIKMGTENKRLFAENTRLRGALEQIRKQNKFMPHMKPPHEIAAEALKGESDE